MAKNSVYSVPYKRKREGKTNYKKRLALLKSELPRLVVRKTNTEIIVQIVNYQEDGDKVVTTFPSKKLSKYGWKYSKKSIPAAYLSGIALGKLAQQKKISKAVLDLGLQTPKHKSKLYAVVKGVVDSGLKIPVKESVFPDENRLNGTHVATMTKVEGLFSKYKKEGLDISKIPSDFESVKTKIMG